jgi:lysophospholipase L1-like esterase
MIKTTLVVARALLLVTLVAPVFAAPVWAEAAPAPAQPQASEQASRWEAAIQAFEAEDKAAPPPQGAILFVGSSSIRLWKTLAQDYPDLTVIRRGFGGSHLSDSVRYAPRIILPYKPKQVVVYAGGNDLAAGKSPAQVLADFRALVEAIHASLPETRVTYVSINPSVARRHLNEKVQETNRLIEAFTRTRPQLSYIDSHRWMLGADGKPRTELLASDGLHLNRSGYQWWAAVIYPYLLGGQNRSPEENKTPARR